MQPDRGCQKKKPQSLLDCRRKQAIEANVGPAPVRPTKSAVYFFSPSPLLLLPSSSHSQSLVAWAYLALSTALSARYCVHFSPSLGSHFAVCVSSSQCLARSLVINQTCSFTWFLVFPSYPSFLSGLCFVAPCRLDQTGHHGPTSSQFPPDREHCDVRPLISHQQACARLLGKAASRHRTAAVSEPNLGLPLPPLILLLLTQAIVVFVPSLPCRSLPVQPTPTVPNYFFLLSLYLSSPFPLAKSLVVA